jgi:hypothetical protein
MKITLFPTSIGDRARLRWRWSRRFAALAVAASFALTGCALRRHTYTDRVQANIVCAKVGDDVMACAVDIKNTTKN